jgi:hypothetical protein
MKEVDNIYNVNEKSKASMRLMEEMLGDPTVRKIANNFGIGDIKKIFSVISSLQ